MSELSATQARDRETYESMLRAQESRFAELESALRKDIAATQESSVVAADADREMYNARLQQVRDEAKEAQAAAATDAEAQAAALKDRHAAELLRLQDANEVALKKQTVTRDALIADLKIAKALPYIVAT